MWTCSRHDTSKRPATDLLCPGPRPHGMAGRCAGHPMGRPPGIRLSADHPHPTGVDQDRAGPLQGPPDRPVLAPTAVVPTTCQAPSAPAGCPSTATGPPAPGRVRSSSPSSGGSAPDLLGTVTRSLRAAGLSERAAAVAAQSRRPSTRRVYDSRLRHFFKWGRRRSVHPASASVAEVGDFLLYLFDSGLATATVKNYRSAIAAIHTGFSDGSTVSNNRAIGQLTRGMFVTRPPTRKLVPSWDLFSVLSTLAKPPFEPLGGATLLHLSIKVAFLVAVATSRRRSELHSLSVAAGHIRWGPPHTCRGVPG